MKLKCRGCSVTIRLRDKGAKPGAQIRVTCPRCGHKARAVVAGHAATDSAMSKFHEVMDMLEEMTRGAAP